MTLRLNLGSGGRSDAGWVHVDKAFGDDTAAAIRKTECARMLRWDLTETPWPYKDNSVDLAVAHHFLDLLDADALERALAEVHRVLIPGGWFRISLFDILKSSDAVQAQDQEWFLTRGAPGGTFPEMHAHMVRLNGARKWVTTPELLGSLLIEAGFEGWRESAFHETACPREPILDLDSREGESMFIEAWKAQAEVIESV